LIIDLDEAHTPAVRRARSVELGHPEDLSELGNLRGAKAGREWYGRAHLFGLGCSQVSAMRTGLARQDARDDFDRARRRASWAKLAGWLRGRQSSRSRLQVLGEVTAITGAAGVGVLRLEFERVGRLGVNAEAMVPIGQIVGTVEPSRCFDRHFRPTSQVPRTRFERIAAGIRSGRGMDPVDLYRCGGQYYVLDGHHRIAVARALGERWVLATITDVRLNQPGEPKIS